MTHGEAMAVLEYFDEMVRDAQLQGFCPGEFVVSERSLRRYVLAMRLLVPTWRRAELHTRTGTFNIFGKPFRAGVDSDEWMRCGESWYCRDDEGTWQFDRLTDAAQETIAPLIQRIDDNETDE